MGKQEQKDWVPLHQQMVRLPSPFFEKQRAPGYDPTLYDDVRAVLGSVKLSNTAKLGFVPEERKAPRLVPVFNIRREVHCMLRFLKYATPAQFSDGRYLEHRL